jgi:hypothetical protein
MKDESGLCCPVCKARFRGATECSRCGADLTALMLLAAHAYTLRQVARQALKSGDAQTAQATVQAAQGLHSTAEGGLLQFACAFAANFTKSPFSGFADALCPEPNEREIGFPAAAGLCTLRANPPRDPSGTCLKYPQTAHDGKTRTLRDTPGFPFIQQNETGR